MQSKMLKSKTMKSAPVSHVDVVTTEYVTTAEKLVQRILQSIPAHPEILQFKNPWTLFKVEGFKCTDIGATLSQASWALVEAQQRYREGQRA